MKNFMQPGAEEYYRNQTGGALEGVDRTPIGDYGLAGTAVETALREYNQLGGIPDKAYQDIVESNWSKRARWERLGLTPENIKKVGAIGGAMCLATLGGTIAAGALHPELISGTVHLLKDHIIGPVADFVSKGADKVGDTYKSEILNPLRNKVADVGLLEGNKEPVERATGVRSAFERATGSLQDRLSAANQNLNNAKLSENLASQAGLKLPGNGIQLAEAQVNALKGMTGGAGLITDRVTEATDRVISRNTGPVFDMFRGVLKFFGTGNEKATRFALDGTNTLGKIMTPIFGEKYLAGGTKYENAGKFSDIARYAGIGAGAFGAGILLKPFRRIGDTYRMMFPTKSAGPMRMAEERMINEKMRYAEGSTKETLKLAKAGLVQRERALAATARNFALEQRV